MSQPDPSQRPINVSVGGDVTGTVFVAGRDVIVKELIVQQARLRALRAMPVSPPEMLVGRGALFARVRAALEGGGAVLLFGLGGMGKTALAASLACAALLDRQRYPGGVLWLTALDRSLEDLCDEVLRRLGEPELVKQPADAKPALVRDRLGALQLMVTLDDVDAASKSAFEWQKQAQPPGAPLLVTSRAELDGFDGEEVAELERANSLRLLRHAAGRTGDMLSPPAADAICAALGDHPLALEVAGAHLKRRPVDPDELLDDLGAAHERIKALTIGAGSSKDTSVYLSLDLSWQPLSAEQRRVLARLCAFFAETTVDALLMRAAGLERLPYKETAGALYNVSLLHERAGRWSVHALVRAFVRAALGEEEWLVAQRADTAGCVFFAHDHVGGEPDDIDALDAERVNLLGAAQWAAEHGYPDMVNQLAWDLVGSQFLDMRGYAREAVTLLDAAVAAARALDDRQSEAVYLMHHGLALSDLGQYAAALKSYEHSLVIRRETGDRDGESRVLANLGTLHLTQGRIDESAACYDQAIRIAFETGDTRNAAIYLGNIAAIYRYRKEYERADEAFHLALKTARDLDAPRFEANVLGSLGSLYAERGNAPQAVEHYQQALNIVRSIGDWTGEAALLDNLGAVYTSQSAYDKARQVYNKALDVNRQSGNRLGEGMTLLNMAILDADEARTQQAVARAEQARNIFADLGSRYIHNCDGLLSMLRGSPPPQPPENA